jgi:hypothetical protein
MEIYDEIGIVFLCIRMGIRAGEPHMHTTARDDRQKHVAVVQLSTIDTRRRGPDSRAKTLLDSVHACIGALYVNMHSHHFDITIAVQKACVSGLNVATWSSSSFWVPSRLEHAHRERAAAGRGHELMMIMPL